jgi:hypothetical protein
VKRLLMVGLALIVALSACGGVDDTDEATGEPVEIGPIYYSVSSLPNESIQVKADQWSIQLLDDFYVILFENQDENITVSLENIPQDLAPGAYDLGTASGPQAALQVGDIASEDVTFYDSNVTGTLTINEISDMISGSFEFTAAERAPSDDGLETATVIGEFANVPLP